VRSEAWLRAERDDDAGASAWSRRGAGGAPLIVGHRGASALAPENSLEAFRRADVDGADGVELDVLRCASGEVIVFHDDDLLRLGGRPERIAQLSLTQLRALRLTSGAAIPTLEEVLEACGPRLLVNVELKAMGVPWIEIQALVDAVAAIVAHPQVAPRILISSFHPYAIAVWQRRLPAVPAGLLFEKDAALPLRRAWALPFLRPFSVHPEAVLCEVASVRDWHRRGMRVNVWTVDAPEQLRRLAAMDVDGLITNDPGAARRALAAR
jgi:glycerophosphoryl diester phosphodiesterase